MAQITVGRVGRYVEGALNVKIDRTTALGNPFKIQDGYTRDMACKDYRAHLERAYLVDYKVRNEITRILQTVESGTPVNLQCWCKPKRCHGHEIKQFIEGLLCDH